MSSKIETKTPPEEIARLIEVLHSLPHCKFCKKNEKAETPFTEMQQIEITPLAENALKATALKHGLKEETCLICYSIDIFSKLSKTQQIELLKQRA